MFASIRRYRLQSGDMNDLERRADSGFAEEIAAQPGFVSYEFIDCGEGRVATVSIFRDADQAEASRDLAQRWTDENLQDFQFERLDALHGEIKISRAADDMLEPGHVGAGRGFASLRRYRTDSSVMSEVMHIADTDLADRMQALDGFEAYHVVDCGDGEVFAMTVVRDRDTIAEVDRLASEFVRDRLADYQIESIEQLNGEVAVSRAMADLLEPAHA